MSDVIIDILKERGKLYGDFSGHALVTQKMKNEVRSAVSWIDMTVSQQESIDMILHKIGRIVNGNPNYIDSWVDICGYSQLVIDQLKK